MTKVSNVSIFPVNVGQLSAESQEEIRDIKEDIETVRLVFTAYFEQELVEFGVQLSEKVVRGNGEILDSKAPIAGIITKTDAIKFFAKTGIGKELGGNIKGYKFVPINPFPPKQ